MGKTPTELAYAMAKVLQWHGYILEANVHTVRVILQEVLEIGQDTEAA